MRLGEFWEALEVYWDEKRSDRRHVAELARGLGVRIVNTFVKKPIKKVECFWRMPWDAREDDAARQMEALPIEKRAELARQFIERLDNGRKSEN